MCTGSEIKDGVNEKNASLSKAVEYLNKAALIQKEDPGVQNELGLTFDMMNYIEESVQAFSKAIEFQ